jgi:hypothetical protein
MGWTHNKKHKNHMGWETLKMWRYRIIAMSIMAVVISLIPVSVTASSEPSGLTVTNAGIVDIVSPGQVLTQTMMVSIGNSDPSTNISITVTGLAQSLSGGYILLDPAQDTNSDTARPFVAVDPTSFQLQPGQSQNITATVTIPQNLGNAAYFAIINIAEPPVTNSGSQVALVYSVNVPVFLTVQGSQLIQTGKITGVNTGTITNGQPVDITTTFQNTGNTYFKVEGSVSVTNAQGVTLQTVPVPLTGSSIIPGMSRNVEAIYTPSGSLAPGTYNISLKIMLSDGTLLDQSTSSFTVKAPYVPPAALGNVNLIPSGASTLQSSDGTISIYFPLGAAAIPVSLSLNNIAAAQLPAAPTGFALTGNAFDVEGLTGLLAKNATVTVKYTSDDLSTAKGKASDLLLMRWDVGTNEWVIPGTKVDTKAMTLSANSNQMGIWAIAVGTVKSAEINWTMIGIIAVALIIVVILAFLLMSRRKPKQKPANR